MKGGRRFEEIIPAREVVTRLMARHSTIRLHFAPGAEVGPCSREAGATADQESYSASAQSFRGQIFANSPSFCWFLSWPIGFLSADECSRGTGRGSGTMFT